MAGVTSIERIFAVGQVVVDGRLSKEAIGEAIASVTSLINKMFTELGWPGLVQVDIRPNDECVQFSMSTVVHSPREVNPLDIRRAISCSNRGEIRVKVRTAIPSWR